MIFTVGPVFLLGSTITVPRCRACGRALAKIHRHNWTMLDRKLQSLTLPFFTGLAGVVLGAALVSRTEDTVTAKTLRIVDEDGNERILADSNGITVNGVEKGDAVQVKAGGKAQIVFQRDSETFISLGEVKGAASGQGSLDGLIAYDSGAPRFSLTATRNGGFLVLDTVKTARTIEELFDRQSTQSTYISLTAIADSPILSLGDSTGKTKDISLEE